MAANDRQVGGRHYKDKNLQKLEHWDIVHLFSLDYFQGQITKYVMRWKDKGGIQDLEKARHYLDKYIEIEETEGANCAKGSQLPQTSETVCIPRTGPEFSGRG